MSQIKAIETSYKGYRFRSRLEARWAVFFDTLGVPWQYELQGYEHNGVRYLPDFFLPKSETWIEVKGGDDALQKEKDNLSSFLDCDCPLQGVQNSGDAETGSIYCPGLLILGDIPDPTEWGPKLHRLIQHSEGIVLNWAIFGVQGPAKINTEPEWPFDIFIPFNDENEPGWTTKSIQLKSYYWWNQVRDAYAAARSARFEHGESGAPRTF